MTGNSEAWCELTCDFIEGLRLFCFSEEYKQWCDSKSLQNARKVCFWRDLQYSMVEKNKKTKMKP